MLAHRIKLNLLIRCLRLRLDASLAHDAVPGRPLRLAHRVEAHVHILWQAEDGLQLHFGCVQKHIHHALLLLGTHLRLELRISNLGSSSFLEGAQVGILA